MPTKKIYKMQIKVGEVVGEMQVIAWSEVTALVECLRLLQAAGIDATEVSPVYF